MKILNYLIMLLIIFSQGSASAKAKEADDVDSWQTTITTEIFGHYLINNLPVGYLTSPIKSSTSPDGSSFSALFGRVGDTPSTWQEMVSIEAYKGFATYPSSTPRTFLDYIAKGKSKFCEKSFYKNMGDERIGEFSASTMLRGCVYVQSPSVGMKIGEAYYEIYIAVAGKRDMYLLSRFFKTSSYDPETFSLSPEKISEIKSSLMPIDTCKKAEANKCVER